MSEGLKTVDTMKKMQNLRRVGLCVTMEVPAVRYGYRECEDQEKRWRKLKVTDFKMCEEMRR